MEFESRKTPLPSSSMPSVAPISEPTNTVLRAPSRLTKILVGGLLGGIGLVLCVAYAVWWLHRRKRYRRGMKSLADFDMITTIDSLSEPSQLAGDAPFPPTIFRMRKPSSGIEAERATSIHHAAKHNRSGSFEQDLCTFARFRDLFTHVLSHHLVDVVSCSSYVAIRVVVVAIAEMRQNQSGTLLRKYKQEPVGGMVDRKSAGALVRRGSLGRESPAQAASLRDNAAIAGDALRAVAVSLDLAPDDGQIDSMAADLKLVLWWGGVCGWGGATERRRGGSFGAGVLGDVRRGMDSQAVKPCWDQDHQDHHCQSVTRDSNYRPSDHGRNFA
ncbi:hypothetical protein B0H14DRAFT_2569458 [Mycena olivaceomarginata]|nr:hypothetical protein B0H14DRAFT_2569458 [Mycena olivaceomarginata]